jgi:Na+/proline symporter
LSVANLGSYLGDLMMLQRYLAADSPRTAARAFVVNMSGGIAVIIALVMVGLLLWVWYGNHPDPNLPEKADQVLAYFVANALPAGVSGLLIASILAATMSSMTSGIIALAGTLTNDWVKRFGRVRSPVELLQFGRYASIGVGVLAVLTAGFASKLGTLFQISQAVLGAFLGPMLGCMVIVVSGWKVRPRLVLAGMVLGVGAGWAITFSAVSVVWVAVTSALTTVFLPLLFRPR